MPARWERRRVLLAAAEGERGRLREQFAAWPLCDWEVVEAESCRQARFLRQLGPCDVLILDASLPREAGDLKWLSGREPGPVLFLADASPEAVLDALREGADCWLPRTLALENPALLAAALERLATFAGAGRPTWRTAEELADCRRQCDRLARLLWEAVPGGGRGRWLSQRHVLERFEEEVARSRRHGTPLAVVLGEVSGEASDFSAWATQRLCEGKRCCDVAGQYGLNGFLLLLPYTTEAGAAGCCRRLGALLRPGPSAAGPHACFGIAAFSPEFSTPQSLLRRAEESLTQARNGERPPVP